MARDPHVDWSHPTADDCRFLAHSLDSGLEGHQYDLAECVRSQNWNSCEIVCSIARRGRDKSKLALLPNKQDAVETKDRPWKGVALEGHHAARGGDANRGQCYGGS